MSDTKAEGRAAIDALRGHIRQAEHEIKTAVVVAVEKLTQATGLGVRSIDIDIIDVATYMNDEATIIGGVKVKVGRL